MRSLTSCTCCGQTVLIGTFHHRAPWRSKRRATLRARLHNCPSRRCCQLIRQACRMSATCALFPAQVPQLFVNQLVSSTLRWRAVGLRIELGADLDGPGAGL